ncbi:MAG: inorganic pyrophosphatase, partial [Porticoccus sp.]|nr:inorganic pyrophosphatase [Porticoccus sp.]
PIGVLNMSDESGVDAKLLAVPHTKLSKLYDHVNEISDLPELLIKQIQHYFENYKALEPGKWVKVEAWEDAAAACEEILASRKRFLN